VMPPQEALRQLLANTGLSFQFSGPVQAEVGVQAKETVNVTAELPDNTNLSRLPEPLLDTPQTVNVVPKAILADEQNRTLTDALRNVPGISIAAGESGAQGDNLTIRGFTARNDIYLDGIRDFGSYYRDDFNLDQVEVLEGPAGVEFGRGSTGGVINQESKIPTTESFVDVNGLVGTDLTRRLTADINEPLTGLPDDAAFRVNAMGTEGGVAGRPFAENRRFGVAPSLLFGMHQPTRLILSYEHFTESDTPDYGLPWFLNGLAPGVDRHAYYGLPDANFLRTNDDVVTVRANHTYRNNVDLHTIGRFANYPRNVQITEPQICSNASISVPVGGWVTALPTSSVTGKTCPFTTGTFSPATALINRNQLQIKSVEGDLWDNTELTAHFKALGTRNDLVAGVEGGREVSNPIRTSYTINGLNTVPSTTFLNPNTGQPFGGTGYISSVAHTTSRSVGLYFLDTVKIGHLFELSGGVRWDRFGTTYSLYQPGPVPAGGTVTATVPQTFRVDQQPTYRAAFVYKPSHHGSVYFDYGTSFNPAAESLSLSIGLANASAAPEENESYEAGAKWSFLHEHLRVEGAVFRTEKDNARETDPTNSNNIVAAGNQRVQGVQASAVGQLPHGMDLIVGYAYLDSKVISSKFFPTAVGYPLANVPANTFNFFVTRRIGLDFSGGFGGNFVDARTASSTVPYVPTSYGPATTFAAGSAPCSATATTCYQVLSTAMKQVPGYWVFNAMVRRPLTEHIDLQANVYNLTNNFYIDQPHPSHLIPAPGLSALFGANFRFR
jgi:catecholate siderophore receptor